MIKYDRLWKTMQKKGISTYWLREKCGIDRKTIRRLIRVINKTLS